MKQTYPNEGRKWPKLLALFLFIWVVQPLPVLAQEPVTVIADPFEVEDVAVNNLGWADSIAFHVLEVADWIQTHLERAAQAVADALGKLLQTSALLNGMQDIINETHRQANMMHTMKSTDEHIVVSDHGCHTVQSGQSAQNMLNAARAAAAGASLFEIYYGNGRGPTGPAKQFSDGCKYGWRSSTLCPSGSAANASMVIPDGDLHRYSVLGPLQYSIPAATTLDDPMANGTGSGSASHTALLKVITFPGPGQITTHDEMAFVTAVAYCRRLKPHMPADPPSGSSSGSSATAPTLNQTEIMEKNFDAASQTTLAYDECVERVFDRTAVSQAAGSQLGGAFQQMYNTQLDHCRDMYNRQIIDQPTEQDCETNGMSTMRASYLRAHKYSTQGFQKYLRATGMTEAQIVELSEQEGQRAVDAYEAARQEEKRALIDAELLLQNVQGATPNPNAVPKSQ